MIISRGQCEVIFHDPTRCTEYMLGESAHLTLFDIGIDNYQRTSTVKIILNGAGAEVEVYGLFFGMGEESFQISHEVIHQAPQTKSSILTRGALGGRAKADYKGNIRITKGMAGCAGRQEARTLLLSREARIDTVPHLEIGNNDVACAHSVSVSYIDEVKRFYCESRGLSEAETVKVIIEGHFSAVLDKIEGETRRAQVEKMLKKL